MTSELMKKSPAARDLSNVLPTLTDGAHSYTTLQLFFLARLAEFVRVRIDMINLCPDDQYRMQLANRALFSTYLDCVRLDVADEARIIVAGQGIRRTQL